MACNIDEIINDSLDEVRTIIQGDAGSITVKDNYAIFEHGAKWKIKTRNQAVKAAESKQKAIEKWATAKFGKAFAQGWTNLASAQDVILDFSFPGNLKKAYNTKLGNDVQAKEFETRAIEANENDVDGDIMPMDNMANISTPVTQDVDDIDITHYIKAKKNIITEMDHKLADLYDKQRKDKSNKIQEEISRVKLLKGKMEDQLRQIEASINPVDDLFDLFEEDIQTINILLEGDKPPIANLYEAQNLLAYLDNITNYSNQNKANQLIIKGDKSAISQELKDRLHVVSKQLGDIDDKIYKSKQAYLMDIIRDSPKLKSLYEENQIEEIRDMLVKDGEYKDISYISMLFMPLGKKFKGDDSLLAQMIRSELDTKRAASKNLAGKLIGKLTKQTPDVRTYLKSLGYTVSFKNMERIGLGTTSFELFKQLDEFGNKSGNFVKRYSDRWNKFEEAFRKKNGKLINAAITNNSSEEKEFAFKQKFEWHDQHTNFFDISRIPELADDPELSKWKSRFNRKEADAYKQSLIDEIGEYQYNKLVEEQKDKLNAWSTEMKNVILGIYYDAKVTNFDDLSEENRYRIKYITAVNDPFKLIDSQKANQKGKVDVLNDNSSNQHQSQMRFNSFFPKRKITDYNENSGAQEEYNPGYYDPKFDEISSHPILLEYWKLLVESAEFINMAVADGNTKLNKESIPNFKRTLLDMFFNKDVSSDQLEAYLLTNTWQHIKDLFANKLTTIDRGDEISKGSLANSVASEIYKTKRLFKLKFKRLGGDIQKGNIDLSDQNREAIQMLLSVTNSITYAELLAKTGMNFNADKILDSFIGNNIVEEQATDIPTIMKAYLDMASEYKARKDAHANIKIMKDLYAAILPKKTAAQANFDKNDVMKASIERYQKRLGSNTDDTGLRVNAVKKIDDFYKRNILGTSNAEEWIKGGKNRTNEEKKLVKELEYEIERLADAMKIAPQEKQAALELQIKDIQNEIENIGAHFTLAAGYNSTVNKMAIFTGLAWNIKAGIINRYQGWFQMTINDGGKYASEGNFTVANAFINKKILAKVAPNSPYAEEIRKTRIFIRRIGVLQDATNEMDRAKNSSGRTGLAKKLNPFYLTEYIEWHNQTPTILGIFADSFIKVDPTHAGSNKYQKGGVPFFDGSGFPAHDLVNGELVLKPEFRTPENIKSWEDFDSQEYSNVITKTAAVLSVMNGDYSKTGTVLAKSFIAGKSLMMFKTWLGAQLWQRFAFHQTDIELGIKDFDGFYTGTIASKKTNFAGSAAIVTGMFAASAVGMPLILTGVITTLLAAKLIHNKVAIAKENRTGLTAIKEDAAYSVQLLELSKGIMNKAAMIFVNTPVALVAGKVVMKEYKYDKLNLSDQERQNLNTLITEIMITLGMLGMKAALAGLMAGDDEDEKKYLDDGKTLNPNFKSKGQKEKNKQWSNVVENQTTRMLGDMTMYYNPKGMYDAVKFQQLDRVLSQMLKFSQGVLDGDPDKMFKSASKMAVPGVFDRFGFGAYMDREFDNDEWIDKLFQTDLKKDSDQAEKDRKEYRTDRTEELRILYNYDQSEPQKQIYLDGLIDKRIDSEMNISLPTPWRGNYNDDQNLK